MSSSAFGPRIAAGGDALPFDRTEGGITAASFRSILHRVREEQDPRLTARRAAEDFVAQTLVLPILKSLREQNQAAEPFAPGDYERTIGGLFDMEIASRIVRAQQFPIVDAVARNLLREQRTPPASVRPREQGGSHDDADRHTQGAGAAEA